MPIRLLLAVAMMFACAASASAQRTSSRRTSAAAPSPATPSESSQTSSAVSFAPPTFLPPVTSPLANPDDWAGGVKAEIGEVETVDGRPLRICGWTQGSFTASTDKASQLPMGFNYKANQFLLQQNWLQIDRAAKAEDAVSPTVGFRSDTILPGSDYLFTLDRGLFDQQLTAHHGMPELYGIDPVQLYVETYHPNVAEGMTLTVGRFYAPFGIETVDAPGNALLSHSYTFIYDPYTQIGAMSGVKFNSDWSAQAGMVIGNDIFFSSADEPTFSGNIRWAPSKGKNSLRFAMILDAAHYSSQSFNNLNLFEITYKHRFNDRLKFTLAGTFAYQDQVPDVGLATWFGIQQYWTWQLGKRCSATTRLEFFNDAQGVRTGYAGLYTSLTSGVSLQLSDRLKLRPELRYDYNGYSRPFENKHGLFLVASDFIWVW
jgi:hypothetical protein